MSKRGQATVFIILGIIVVIIAVALSYLQSEDFRERVQNIAFRSVAVPEQAQGVVNYVEGCIEDLTYEGLDILGRQGGYIYFPDNIDKNPRSYLQFTPNVRMPYWVYGENVRNIPGISEIETDMENFIESGFEEECGFDVYRELGYNFLNDDFNVEVLIGNADVDVNLISDLNVNIKGELFNLKDYIFISISSRFKEFYDMAIDIVNRETTIVDGKIAPLEFNTLNMIALWSKQSEDIIPPISEFNFNCNPDRYNLNEVAEELQSRISAVTNYLQLEGTNLQIFGSEFYESMLIENVFSEFHEDVDVQFNFFQGWPFILDITPRNGILLKSSILKIPIPLLPDVCFNSYDFRYDLIYPIVINMEADGQLFRFPIELYIEDNYARRNIFGERVNSVNVPSKFCEEGQKISEKVDIQVRDPTNENIEDVRITYVCGVNECVVGTTGENGYNDPFPNCVGGEVHLTREDYAITKFGLDTLDEQEQSFVVNMYPYTPLKAKVKVKDLNERNEIINTPRTLRENEMVIIQLNRLNEDLGGIDETIFVTQESFEDSTISLVPGLYNAIFDLILNEPINLEGESIQGFDFESELADSTILGHVEIDDMIITESDLLNENVQFNVFGIQPRVVGDLIRGYELQDVVDRNREALSPEFS